MHARLFAKPASLLRNFRLWPVSRQLDLGPTRARGRRSPTSAAQAREISSNQRRNLLSLPASARCCRMSLGRIHLAPEAPWRDAGPAPECANEVGGIGVPKLEPDI